MADGDTSKHSGKTGACADKSARLAEALRANLARRKAQKRARTTAQKPGDKQERRD